MASCGPMLASAAMKMAKKGWTRRDFLKILSTGAVGGVLIGTGLGRFRKQGTIFVLKQARPLLGTLVSITIHHPDEALAEKGMKEAFKAVEKVDRVMSIHRKESDVSRVNALAGRGMVSVDPSLMDVIQTANRVHAESGGAFDVTCLSLMQLFGFYSASLDGKHFPKEAAIQKVMEAVGQKQIQIDEHLGKIGLAKEGGAIDLGGIGKGYAVDCAAEALKKEGVENALIDAGGNILALGSPMGGEGPEESWRVAIKNPHGDADNPYFETVSLNNNAVATSGNYEQSVVLDGRRVGHLFDLRSGCPAESGVSATVAAKTAALADALSTSAYVLGPASATFFGGEAKEIYFHGFKG